MISSSEGEHKQCDNVLLPCHTVTVRETDSRDIECRETLRERIVVMYPHLVSSSSSFNVLDYQRDSAEC